MAATGKVGNKGAGGADMSCPWLKRVGFYGFLFFLVKGLMWLIVPLLLVYFGFNE